jgi:hypothetical protein
MFDKNKQAFDEISVHEQLKNQRKSSIKSDHGVFDMENMMSQNDLNSVDELDESNIDESLAKDQELMFETSPTSLKNSSPGVSKLNSLKSSNIHSSLTENFSTNFNSAPSELVSRKDTYVSKISNVGTLIETGTVIEPDKDNLSEVSTNKMNISTTAYNSFIRIIGSLGPVLTCKYCCNDLLKMAAICYMNSKCLSLIETTGLDFWDYIILHLIYKNINLFYLN